MKSKLQILRLGLAALLFALPVESLLAAPPHTGIHGQTLIYVPGFWVEVSPGLWVGDGGFSFGWPAAFTVFSGPSGREVTHVSTGPDGSFEVSLPPGRYIVVPDTLAFYAPMSSSVEVTVTAKHQSDAFIYYQSKVIYGTPL
jgi:hypothetical protein